MRLHTDRQLFKDAINFASRPATDGGLGISPLFIEKDYWVSRSLKLMAEHDKDGRAVFKGGTSLSKAYGIGARFSEDIDVAISDAWTLSGNQLKNLIRKTARDMTEGLDEIPIPGKTSKGSHYYKAYYHYPQIMESLAATSINPGQILVEINSFANPYPSEQRVIQSFLTIFLQQSGNEQLIEEYDMRPFVIHVLDKRRTLTEKLVSLIRCSLADEHHSQLSAKIRHFYDLYYLYHDKEIRQYLDSSDFLNDFHNLFTHDRQQFSKPEGWQRRNLDESPLFSALENVWSKLEPVYMKELPELAYNKIPDSTQILESIHAILMYIINNKIQE